eukprot:TRINITY_DN11054_c0_g1_i1.p1 TRINITY_DN11054_c0_g1~~TRINITY_DN11054_c0_g1_i1.p1  ORF type:complete len:243 (-),score=15.23 TRINITY_DN11054_c0_g1_i1:356-1084(-)
MTCLNVNVLEPAMARHRARVHSVHVTPPCTQHAPAHFCDSWSDHYLQLGQTLAQGLILLPQPLNHSLALHDDLRQDLLGFEASSSLGRQCTLLRLSRQLFYRQGQTTAVHALEGSRQAFHRQAQTTAVAMSPEAFTTALSRLDSRFASERTLSASAWAKRALAADNFAATDARSRSISSSLLVVVCSCCSSPRFRSTKKVYATSHHLSAFVRFDHACFHATLILHGCNRACDSKPPILSTMK